MTASVVDQYSYPGGELEIFAQATNWKQYWLSRVAPYVKGDVLEVGAGMGGNTQFLRPLCRGRYVSLEPDVVLANQAKEKSRHSAFRTEVRAGTVASLASGERFDCALYIDVLEHIEDDRAELGRIAGHMRPGGHIVVLGPAHNALYSPFDKAIGHFRRYSRATLVGCSPPNTEVLRIIYLDSIGVLLSLSNRLVLRRARPTQTQIQLWDRAIIPVSRYTDPLLGFRLGKSILAIWRVKETASK